MEEYDISERSLLNASPETVLESKIDTTLHKPPSQVIVFKPPPAYADLPQGQGPSRKRERVAYRLDSIADWIWDTSANILQLRTTGEGWTAETCSYVFAVLCLLSLVATLFAHEKKPLPEWPQLITINSIVSLFSLLMRAGVGLVLAEGISQTKWQWFRKPRKLHDMERFDAASRGAWGSIALLIHTKPEGLSYIVALGALVTILAAVTGFFLQQLVIFHDCQQKDLTAEVRVAKTNYCQAVNQGSLAFNEVYPPMAAAINSGMIQSVQDHTSAVIHGCTSGNCTFPSTDGMSFSSVAVGYACENITARVRSVERIGNSSLVVLPFANNKTIELCPMCDDPPVVLGAGAGVESYNGSEALATIYMLFRTGNYTNDDSWQGLNCSLLPTVNTYAVNITNSKMTETLLQSVQIPSTSAEERQYLQPIYSHMLRTPRTLRHGVWEDCSEASGPDVNISPIVELDPRNISGPGLTKYYPRDCVWRFHQEATESIRVYFGEIFDGERLYSDLLQITTENRANGSFSDVSQARKARRKGPMHLRQIYGNGTLDIQTVLDVMLNVSTAMTTVVRTHYTEGSGWDAKGDMWVTTTCVSVDWRWISFPVIMIGLTGIFLVLVVVENRGVERERLWKSSVLATLFCGVDHEVTDNAALVSKRAMYDVAKSTSVSLQTQKGTLRLLAR